MTQTSNVGQIKNHKYKKEQGELSTVSKHITILPRIYDRVVEAETRIDASVCVLNTTDVSISDQPELPKTSNMGVIRSKERSDQPESPETSNIEVIRIKVRSKHILIGAFSCLAVMTAIAGVAFLVYYVTRIDTDNTEENATAINDNNVTTIDDLVTINNDNCFNYRANCNTSTEKKKTGKDHFKLKRYHC